MSGSNQQGPGGPNSGQGYRYGYTPGSTPPRKDKDNGWGEWIGIAVMFLIPSTFTKIIAVIWALKKIATMSRQQRDRYYDQARQAAHQVRDEFDSAFRSAGTASGPSASGNSSTLGAASSGASAGRGPSAAPPRSGTARAAQPTPGKEKKARKIKGEGGNGLIIGGAILTGIFGLGTVGALSEFLSSLFYGHFFTNELVGVLSCAVFLFGGLFMLFSGINGKHRRDRYLNYLAYIGANREVNLAHMAASFDVSVGKLCKDLRRMLSKGILPTGYLDLAEGKLYLTEMGYRAPEPEPEPTPEEARQAAEEKEDSILREIRQVNDEIPDEAMSAKIDRIEEITGKILAYQKAHPNREGQLRSFLNYYLPTTLKILRAYAQLEAQGIEGENISAAKARIEGMMDQVVAGFEKQLDKLFQDEAMDINSDVQVLENMLKKDGLSGNQDMTMTM